jgi:hypothetical protein
MLANTKSAIRDRQKMPTFSEALEEALEAQIERVTGSMVTVVGELQAIAHDQFPQLDAIDQLALPAGSEGS